MQIGKNSRQMPKTSKYTANKFYFDTLYGYLQSISVWDGKEESPRIITKTDVNFTKIGEALGDVKDNQLKPISRQTISKRFKDLQELGLVEKLPNKNYKLNKLESTDAFLVESETLKRLVTNVKERTISVYIYLLNRFIANKEQEFMFTYAQLKTFCGISVASNNNDDIILDILNFLSDQLHLIKYEIREEKNEEYNTYKTCFYLVDAKNKLEKV